MASRRAGLSTPPAAVLTGCSLVLTAAMLLYGDTAWFVLPTLDTVAAASDHLADGWSVMNATPAPVVPAPGLILCAGAALGLGAFWPTRPPSARAPRSGP